MKRCKWIGLIAMLSLLLAACGNNNNGANNPAPKTTPTEDQQKADTNNKKNETDTTQGISANPPYTFVDFDLEADFDDKIDALDIKYEYEPNKIDASYYDKIQDIRLNGKEAFEALKGTFASFDFDEKTPDEDVLNAVSEAFNIPDNAKIDLDIEYTSGVEKEYKK